MKTWSDFLSNYYKSLKPPACLPDNIEWLLPQKEESVQNIISQFFYMFYNDAEQRTLWLGINPGRFGAGVTGLNFTAPKQLAENCGIEHPLGLQSELSAEFVYKVIEQYGGSQLFYQFYFIGAVCPLGFVQHGKNLNYYDDKKLLQIVEPFIIESLQCVVDFNINRQRCICIGGEKNFSYLKSINEKYKWFKEIIPLPHPRFIMQYRRKRIQEFIDMYLKALIAH